MFADIIRTAENEHEIYFLLTSYIDAVRFSNPLNTVSEQLTRLPLNGTTDVKDRFDKLMAELDTASKLSDERTCVVLREGVHILGAALSRLRLIEEKNGLPAGFDATPVASAARIDGSATDSARGAVDILLVEDNPFDVRMTRKALEGAGVPYHLHVVKDGDDAMSYLCQAEGFDNAPKPDVVLVDLSIPHLDAQEVLNEIKSSDALKHVPVVALTCSLSERYIQRTRHMNADHFVVKPLGLEAFVNEMKKIEVLAMRT